MDTCPQCGEEAEEFAEGVCVECRDANQAALDRWESLSDKQREDEIHWNAHYYGA